MPASAGLLLDTRTRGVREVSTHLSLADSDAFVDALSQPGKVIDTVSLIAEFNLKGKDITQLVNECLSRTAVRISGTGDLQTEHVPNLIRLAKACPATQFWGMTRKLEIAKAVNNKADNLKLMVSVDSSSPESVWKYNGKLCWGPRYKTDRVPSDSRIKTIFPYHAHGKVVGEKEMPKDKRDCPAVRHTKSGCLSCGRCWTW